MKMTFGLAAFLAASITAHYTQAQVPNPKLFLNMTITNVSSDATKFGGCKARFTFDFGTDNEIGIDNGGTCDKPEISFGCDGTQGHSKSVGNALYANAQLAFVAGKQVNIRVNPAYVVNGICVANRIDVREEDVPPS
jgi:hypothetical protein